LSETIGDNVQSRHFIQAYWKWLNQNGLVLEE